MCSRVTCSNGSKSMASSGNDSGLRGCCVTSSFRSNLPARACPVCCQARSLCFCLVVSNNLAARLATSTIPLSPDLNAPISFFSSRLSTYVFFSPLIFSHPHLAPSELYIITHTHCRLLCLPGVCLRLVFSYPSYRTGVMNWIIS